MYRHPSLYADLIHIYLICCQKVIDIFVVTLRRFFAFPVFLVLLLFSVGVVVVVVVGPPLTLRDGPRSQKRGFIFAARFVGGVGLEHIQ